MIDDTPALDRPEELYHPTREELRGFAAERRDDEDRERRRRDGTLGRRPATDEDGGL
jgi:hypothetical protein